MRLWPRRHLVRPADRRTTLPSASVMRATATVRTKSRASTSSCCVQRRAFEHPHQRVDRHRLRIRPQVRELRTSRPARSRDGLAEADDAAAADVHARPAHVRQRVEAVVVVAGDDVAVVLAARCRGCGCSSRGRRRAGARPAARFEHAQRRARLQTQRLDGRAPSRRRVEGRAPSVHRATRRPCRSGSAPAFAALRGLPSTSGASCSSFAPRPVVEAGRLRAVAAVLRAAAGLDRQQRAKSCTFVGVEMWRDAPSAARWRSSSSGWSSSAARARRP
jgi:hypothetical protein